MLKENKISMIITLAAYIFSVLANLYMRFNVVTLQMPVALFRD